MEKTEPVVLHHGRQPQRCWSTRRAAVSCNSLLASWRYSAAQIKAARQDASSATALESLNTNSNAQRSARPRMRHQRPRRQPGPPDDNETGPQTTPR